MVNTAKFLVTTAYIPSSDSPNYGLCLYRERVKYIRKLMGDGEWIHIEIRKPYTVLSKLRIMIVKKCR